MSKFVELDCDQEEPVIIENDEGEIIFHNFDLEAELAAHELGFTPSLCWFLWQCYETKGNLDTALGRIAQSGELEAVLLLLELGIPPSDDALKAASESNHLPVMRVLIAEGADPYPAITSLLIRPSTAPTEALDLLFEHIQSAKS